MVEGFRELLDARSIQAGAARGGLVSASWEGGEAVTGGGEASGSNGEAGGSGAGVRRRSIRYGGGTGRAERDAGELRHHSIRYGGGFGPVRRPRRSKLPGGGGGQWNTARAPEERRFNRCWTGSRHGRRNLPTFIDYEGRKLVLLTHAEYVELVAARSKVVLDAIRAGRTDAPRSPKLGLSTIERDPEVANFLRERFRGGVTVEQLHASCVEEFGSERTPSAQRISRFRTATRRRS